MPAAKNSITLNRGTFTPNKVHYPHARSNGQTYEELMNHLLRDHSQCERTDNGYVPDGSFDHTTPARAAALA